MQIRLLDLDASLLAQPSLRAAFENGTARYVGLRDLADRLRIVAARRELAELRRRVAQDEAERPAGPCVDFLGSGDFHHITAVLLARFTEAVTVIHVDNHPDWVAWPRTLNCGGWVNQALQLPHVHRVITLGPCSADLAHPETKFANLAAVKQGRLEVFPWRHPPSRVLRDYGSGASHHTRRGQIIWRSLCDVAWEEFMAELTERVPTDAVYLTIDKDALATAEAVTNWDQGELSVSHLLSLITHLAQRRRLVGADVCGEYSPPVFPNVVRRLLSWFDRGSLAREPEAASGCNDLTNGRLLHAFAKVAA